MAPRKQKKRVTRAKKKPSVSKKRTREGDLKPLSRTEIMRAMEQLMYPWNLRANILCREFGFHSFKDAVKFVNTVARIAEEEDHHPDIHIHYTRVLIELSTHATGHLSRKDFMVAQRIEGI